MNKLSPDSEIQTVSESDSISGTQMFPPGL